MTLAALAQATRRLRLGTLVTGIHYRHPAVLANMAAALDIVSEGRLELGIGAGWNEEESGAYGIAVGTPKQRSDRFEEACEVIVGLLSDETTSFRGTYYELTDARCNPKPVQRPHPPICIGGNGEKRTLRTAARFAQHWNFVGGTGRGVPAQAGRAPRALLVLGGTRRRYCCRATSASRATPLPRRLRRRPSARREPTSPSSICRRRSHPRCSSRWPMPSAR